MSGMQGMEYDGGGADFGFGFRDKKYEGSIIERRNESSFNFADFPESGMISTTRNLFRLSLLGNGIKQLLLTGRNL